MSEVHYYDLPATNKYKCEVMLENQLQCQERASVAVMGLDEAASHYCKHHFAVERSLNEAEGTKYIFHDSTGTQASDVTKEYRPPQK